jgi:cytoskeletal protein CcmA (bactofilin family)
MAFAVADRVRETTTTTGTGTLNLDGAVSGFRTFVSGIGDGNVTYYAIVHRTSAEFEIGIGTVTDASTDTLSRTTVLSSSNSNSAVTFSAGTKDVFCTQPASKAVFEDNNADVTLPDDLILGSDSAVLKFGADSDTTLTHTDGTGLTLNSTNKLTFGDAASFVQQSSNGVLRIDGEATIDLNASTAVTVSNDLKLDSDSAVLGFGADNDITITHAADTGLTVNGTFTATGFIIGSANINEAELETIDGVTAGTVAASKAVVVDSNKDIGSFRNVTLTGELDAATLDISGDADIDGTLEADAITIGGTAINTVIAGVTVTNATNAAHVSVADNESTNEENLITFIEDTSATGNVGLESDGDFTYNPSTGTVTATIFKGNIDAVDGDFDGTLEADAITVGGTALNTVIAGVTVANATTAAVATTVTISDNESTNEDNAVVFTSGGDVDGGNIGLESDGDLTYNPSTGRLTATQLAGTLQTAAQANVTSLGTLTTLTVDNVIINGTTIGHTDDTDLMTVADGVLTVAGEISVTTLDIGGTNVTSTAAELNILDGVTSTAAELNILDGVTSTATELNILDGVTATTAELNLLDGGTSVGSSITLADSDGIVTNDGGTMKTIPASDIKTYVGISAGALAITNLDIDGGTDIGADLVDADEIIVDDGGGGTNRRSDLTRVKKYIFSAVSGDATASDTGALTIANTSVETAMIAADAITEAKIADDAVESEHLNNNVISGQTALTSGLATTDELLISDGGTIKRMDVSVLSEQFASADDVTALAIALG